MIAGALLENAKKAEREGRKSRLRVLVCGEWRAIQVPDRPVRVPPPPAARAPASVRDSGN